MATAMKTQVMALDSSRAWSADSRRAPFDLEVLEGSVLVTVEGDISDRVLASGDVFRSPRRGRVAATGLSPSRIRVTGATTRVPPFAGLAARNASRTARNLLGGTLILAVWFSLWAWVAVGVVRPLSAVQGFAAVASAIGT